ncbi:Dps family protein [Sporosarcina pasteurii]|uniref:Metalloregulation DNA-binding stress protein n=1 Tax=Sporosarcina pasteurii TaxID=1474 RepID=A0A380C8R7_SPOPA|nr:DNA starvation/stationary phase protection protein [Sporosarcina pasteurii]MDS9472720.1 DNA starvation/stationary phase protection protein [Sporosarcina pasteurii]QBQ04375.1 DNA starvation/stationary phase protection protein [Sporosarcina pasteurii]SUJ15485.1 Metalloregulation DNA-binding stress protein [Sporosarcina pasteurii]
MEKLHTALNGQIANWSVLYTKLHRYHWFVKGPHFFTLHEKFEELYNEAASVVDEVAERLLASGGTPVATMKEYLAVATLEETNGETTANEMVASLVEDYKHLKEELKGLAELSEQHGDDGINDLAVGLLVKLDLHIWMLSAYLGE